LKSKFFIILSSPVLARSFVIGLVGLVGYSFLLSTGDDDNNAFFKEIHNTNSATAPQMISKNKTQKSLDTAVDINVIDPKEPIEENENPEKTVYTETLSITNRPVMSLQTEISIDNEQKQWAVFPAGADVVILDRPEKKYAATIIRSKAIEEKYEIRRRVGSWLEVSLESIELAESWGKKIGYISSSDCRASVKASILLCESDSPYRPTY